MFGINKPTNEETVEYLREQIHGLLYLIISVGEIKIHYSLSKQIVLKK